MPWYDLENGMVRGHGMGATMYDGYEGYEEPEEEDEEIDPENDWSLTLTLSAYGINTENLEVLKEAINRIFTNCEMTEKDAKILQVCRTEYVDIEVEAN